jgi:hypothetical protein
VPKRRRTGSRLPSPETVPKATVHASSAQSTETSNTHVTQIAFDALLSGTPAVRASQAPSQAQEAIRVNHILGVIRLCHGWIDDDPDVAGDGRRSHHVRWPRTVWVSVCGASPLAVKLGKGSE